MSQFYKSLALWLTIILLFMLLYSAVRDQNSEKLTLSYTQFLSYVREGRIMQVTLQGKHLTGQTVNGKTFDTDFPDDPELLPMLREYHVEIFVKPDEQTKWYVTLLASWFPMILLIGVWVFFMRQMQAGGGKAMSFGKSRARLLTESQQRVTFADVAGIDEAKGELEEIIEFLKDPKKFTRLGGRIPKGVLLVGPPGTGKTLLARAIAGEAGVPFFSISGSDFVEMFVGVGASRVRDLFIQGKKSAPCIIFIDEIDAVGRHRGAGLGGGHDEREQTLNQLLVEMDGFETNEGVILIAATNRPDVLDPALLRPGRFDRQVIVPKPDIKGRTGILAVHTRGMPLSHDVELDTIARGTPGFSGADLENLVNEAALLAARANKSQIERVDLDRAKDKVIMGVERKSMIISDEERRNTAYHEAGHALVAFLIPGADPIHKVSIIPRGMALGLTQQLPIDEKHTYPKSYLMNNLTILFGGRAAEELVSGEMTTGAGNDIERATELARKMVCEWGMSANLGPLTFGRKDHEVFLGKELAYPADYSQATALQIDQEIRRIVLDSYDRAKSIIEENIARLHLLARTLLEKESLDGEQIREVILCGEPRARVADPLLGISREGGPKGDSPHEGPPPAKERGKEEKLGIPPIGLRGQREAG
ncbi:MAG: ATP-dependent zinc metalloprotease FtsH [bacterium]